MGLLDRFRKRQVAQGGDALGMGLSDGADLPAGEGGPSLWAADLAEVRWTAMQQALDSARRGTDPERWAPDGRMAENYEWALAHMHEGVRDRAASFVFERVREDVQTLYDVAAEIAPLRADLRRVDDELAEVDAHHAAAHEHVDDYEAELARYERLKSHSGRYVKWLIIILIVVSEALISGHMFETRLGFDVFGLGYLFALGVITIFIVIPHYAAQGFKEGITQHHRHELDVAERDDEPATVGLLRAVHKESAEDRGFRVVTALVALLLLALTVPLSLLRAERGFEGWLGFAFFLLLQLGISGYFFMREWHDHGSASHTLLRIDERREQLRDARADLVAELAEATAEFDKAGYDLATTLRHAARWDSHIVETFNETRRYARQLIAIEHPEDEQFIFWSRLPYLGTKESAQESGYPLDPVSEENRALEGADLYGREWWLRESVKSLQGKALATPPARDQLGELVRDWYTVPNPDRLLADFLRRVELPGSDGVQAESDDPTPPAHAAAEVGDDRMIRVVHGQPSVGEPESVSPPAMR